MADKYLNLTDLTAIKTWIEGKFGLKTALETLEDRVDDIVAEGGEPNVIETVKVNGTALTPDAQKAVDVEAATLTKASNPAGPTGTENTFTVTQGETDVAFNYIKQDGSGDVPNYLNARLDSDAFMLATTNYVDANGGKIDVIQVNGTAQTITNKTVNITVPIKVSDITNDSGFQTATDVSTTLANSGDPYQTESDVASAINTAVASAYKYKGSVATYADLPASGATVGDVYDVQADGMNYAWNGTAWDALGAYVDTSVLWTSTAGQTNSLIAATVAEVNAILEPSA